MRELQAGFYGHAAFHDARASRLGKILTYSGSSGALVLEAIDRVIEHMVNYKNVVRANVPRVPGESDNYRVSRRTAGTTLGEFIAETGDFVDSTGSRAKASFPYKTCGTRGKVGRFAQATGRSFANVLLDEIEGKVEDFKDYEEWALFFANTDAVATQWKGLHYLTDSGNVIGCTASAANGSLTLAYMDQLWDETQRTPDVAFMSAKTKRGVHALLQGSQRFINSVTVNGGFVVETYNTTPLLVSSRIADTMAWDGSAVSSLTSGSGQIIYTAMTDKFFIAELTALTMMMLARTTSQWEGFDLFEDATPVNRSIYGTAYLSGFAT